MLFADKLKKSSYKWKLARQECLVSRQAFSFKYQCFVVPTLQLHKILASITTKVNLMNTFSTKSTCSLERNCNSQFMNCMYYVIFSPKPKEEIHTENPKGGSCRLKMTLGNIEDGSLEL